MKALLAQGYDAVFVGCGAPRGRDLDLPGRKEAAHIHVGIDWLASVSSATSAASAARHRAGRRQHRDGLLPLGAALGGADVKVIVRSGFDEMKASPWEKEDASTRASHPQLHVPKAFVHEGGRLTGMTFEIVRAEYDARGRRQLVPTGEPDVFFAATRC
jgi:NADPH-dependent glutamate synthase beta subunit-like oxidoreductase